MKYGSIVVLTGAGISAESGLRTFRAADGLWEDHRVEDVATPEAFERDPVLVHRFYNARRRQLLGGVEPNPAHRALARLERDYPGEVLVVTQNIDDLHERAGSRRLIHMHGELLFVRCTRTGRRYPVEGDCSVSQRCECCEAEGRLRPDIVWFGEMPLQMDTIYEALEACELFVAIGTSGHVYPAAGFVEVAAGAGARTLELNLEASRLGSVFEEGRYGPASEQVPLLVEQLLGG
ncbi:NAD-dependent protein deacylase [Marinobacterium nitratireducens]|uniref:NAD-dependent protein deacylase n=1 Tax=Marinobacterium nitratireducens TaxID=518897 RepID=A0A918DRI4_9GAMM|nr:Sir2 family NAD+-dependent deacetylase [Marinobacterium nitratireducens]GGO81162.1 NAD-dependent protein deacylase [Marinobacterium nitratireducens]